MKWSGKMSNVYFDESVISKHFNICKNVCDINVKTDIDNIDANLENLCCRWGYISGTSRDDDTSVTPGLSTLDTFIIAKISGGTVGLLGYGFVKGTTGSGFGYGADDQISRLVTDTSNNDVDIATVGGKKVVKFNGSANRRGLQGTYRWVAIGKY